ncbi:MAG: 4-alpha-glucanotransferase [Candidatus Hadarchaeales archaeon]
MLKRGSGIVLHVSSLPAEFGVGDFGSKCLEFLDFLAEAGQRIWQVLPLTPTDPSTGNSPYVSSSLFAGNELLVSPELLARDGLLDLSQISYLPHGPVDYQTVTDLKRKILDKAFSNFGEKKELEEFAGQNSYWLEDYALFTVLKRKFGTEWSRWPKEVRERNWKVLQSIRLEKQKEIKRVIFGQYIFFKQWEEIRRRCKELGIKILGDIPIYPAYDSCDVWAHPELFKLDERLLPTHISGVPPDYFSPTGQLWGTPVYRWSEHEKDGFAWWLSRVEHALKLFDLVRIDHFRGLVAYWEVEAGQTTAINGRWVPAPAEKLLSRVKQKFPEMPFVAEDLGVITSDVVEVIKKFNLPGMRVLIFGFGDDFPESIHLPHRFDEHCLAYTGTHDTNTVRGWFENEANPQVRSRVFHYLRKEVKSDELPFEFIKLVMFSRALVSMIPAQDLLGLGSEARMNVPGTASGNWRWRLLPGQLTRELAKKLRELTESAGRTG